MSESKHTPGPWTANGSYVFAGRDCIIVCDTERNEHEQEANARLIAAAPDLLSIVLRFIALPSAAWHPERHAADEAELMQDARAAIAKAEGR